MVLISGPVGLPDPVGVRVRRVETTQEMEDAVRAELPAADVLVMAAAPADFRAAAVAGAKIKKGVSAPSIELAPTPDILATTRGARAKNAVVVGFALETDDALRGGREKLEAKALDMVVVNDARETGAGFGVDTNRVTLLGPGGREEALPLLSKDAVADEILDRVETLLRDRS